MIFKKWNKYKITVYNSKQNDETIDMIGIAVWYLDAEIYYSEILI